MACVLSVILVGSWTHAGLLAGIEFFLACMQAEAARGIMWWGQCASKKVGAMYASPALDSKFM